MIDAAAGDLKRSRQRRLQYQERESELERESPNDHARLNGAPVVRKNEGDRDDDKEAEDAGESSHESRNSIMVSMSTLRIVFPFLMAAACASAQDKPEFAMGWVPEFHVTARQVVQLAEAMPASKYGWRPVGQRGVHAHRDRALLFPPHLRRRGGRVETGARRGEEDRGQGRRREVFERKHRGGGRELSQARPAQEGEIPRRGYYGRRRDDSPFGAH